MAIMLLRSFLLEVRCFDCFFNEGSDCFSGASTEFVEELSMIERNSRTKLHDYFIELLFLEGEAVFVEEFGSQLIEFRCGVWNGAFCILLLVSQDGTR